MRTLDRLFATAITATITSSVIVLPAFSLASSPVHDNQPKPAYIQTLPPEVRSNLQRYRKVCGDALTATNGFSRFIAVSGFHLIALHFHDLRCDDRSGFCKGDRCLHQVYVSHGGRYRLILSEQITEVTLSSIDGTPAIEIEYTAGRQRLLRWNGKHFVGE